MHGREFCSCGVLIRQCRCAIESHRTHVVKDGCQTCRAKTGEVERRLGNWTQTFTGVKFYPLDPRVEEIHVLDIAQGLALTNRWNGQVQYPFSVAAHSLYVSELCEPQHALVGLLHDASEAYIGDMIRPLKKDIPAFQKIENNLQRVIGQKFGVDLVNLPASVHRADDVMLVTEFRDLHVNPAVDGWLERHPVEPTEKKLFLLTAKDWQVTRLRFLRRLYELGYDGADLYEALTWTEPGGKYA